MLPLAATLLILIRTYDAFGVPAHDLETAQRAADGALRTAGLHTEWTTCESVAEAGLASNRCVALPESGEVIVRIIGGPRVEKDDTTLGYAFVDTAAKQGVLATLYAARIATLADQAGIERGTLLGRALAHEVGHLLLGTTAHTPRGLMRAQWTLDELRRRIENDWLFSGTEAAEIRVKLLERTHTGPIVPGDARPLQLAAQPPLTCSCRASAEKATAPR